MLLFRSEEHVTRWLAGRTPGAIVSVRILSDLANAWWDDRLSPDWRPRPRERNQAILESLGLTGQFWKLG